MGFSGGDYRLIAAFPDYFPPNSGSCLMRNAFIAQSDMG